jgi:proline iminopeptidase
MLKLKVFADSGYFVIFFDQRGCGLSKRHDASSITLANYLNDLDIIISRYRKGQQHVYLIGHSWGAMYATMYINSFCSERLKG